MDQQLMTAREIAETFSVSGSTPYSWRRRGVLPSLKVGGCIRFRREDVDRILNPHQTKEKQHA